MKSHPLEPRSFLSGSVNVTLANGVLTVAGDAADNDVEIRIDLEDAAVYGLDDTDIVERGEEFVFTPSDVERIVVVMGDGNDQLLVRGMFEYSGFLISADAGNDRITFENAIALQRVDIKAHPGQ